MKTPNYSYDKKESADRICRKKNKEAGKKMFVVIPDGDEWIIISANELITEELK